MKKDSKERLDKIYEKYDMYFTTYFRRNSYEESVGHMSRFLNLLVGLSIKSKGDSYSRYVKRYAEVFKLAEDRDATDLEKQTNTEGTIKSTVSTKPKAKTATTANKTKTVTNEEVNSYVDKYKETFIKNIGVFFQEGAIPNEGGVNSEQVERLNSLFKAVTLQLTKLQDKRDVYESYLEEVDQQMKVNYSGDMEHFEDWAELEIDLNLFEIKDALNDVLLEMDDLDAEDVDSIMEGMEADIFRLLEDIGDDEDSYEDFKEVEFETKQTESEEQDNEPVTKLIAEDEVSESEGLDFYGLEEVNKDVDLDINLGLDQSEESEDNEDIDLDGMDEDDSEEDFYEVKQKPKLEPKLEPKEEVKPKVETKVESKGKSESNKELGESTEPKEEETFIEELKPKTKVKEEPKLEPKETSIKDKKETTPTKETKEEINLDDLDFGVSGNETESVSEDEEGFDTTKWEIPDEVEDDTDVSEENTLTVLDEPEEEEDEDDDEDDGLNNLEGILGNFNDELPAKKKKKERVVIKDEDASKGLDQFL